MLLGIVTAAVTEQDRGKWAGTRRSPKESFEAQRAARNNDRLVADGRGLVGTGRDLRQRKQQCKGSGSQQSTLNQQQA